MPGSYFKVVNPGVFSLIQDGGRYGHAAMGLSTGGPMDSRAFQWANRICRNPLDATALEISFGGLVLEAQANTVIAVTGAELTVSLNGSVQKMWQSIVIAQGDIVQLGFAQSGVRSYLAVAGGFNINKAFGSTATVVREGVGGLGGRPLQKSDVLLCANSPFKACRLAEEYRPIYGSKSVQLRIIPSYQYSSFTREQKRLFFNAEYRVTTQSDRMGFRLKGGLFEPMLKGVLSEGICLGAVQIPPDGQPIVLMRDRQTIGGYPKIGAVLSVDLDKLTQLTPDSRVCFSPVRYSQGRNIVLQHQQHFMNTPLSFCSV